MPQELSFIYVTGSQSELRNAFFAMLEQGIALDVDEIDQGSLFVDKAKHKRKVSVIGMAFVAIVERSQAAEVLARVKAAEPTAKGYAMAITQTL